MVRATRTDADLGRSTNAADLVVVSADCLGAVAVNRCHPVVLESSVQSNQHFAGQWLTDVCDSRGDSRHDPPGQSADFTGGGCPVWAERTVTPGAILAAASRQISLARD